MRYLKSLFIMLVIAIIFSNFAVAENETIQDKLGITYVLDKLDFITYFTKPLKQKLRENKIDLDLFGGIIQGFDNNIFLDPSRTRDAFLQNAVAGDLTYHCTDDIRLNLDADIVNILYYRFNDNNLLDIEANPGIELDFLEDYLTLTADYKFEWLFFPYDEEGSYISNQYSMFLQNNICEEFYHKCGFRLEYDHFTDGKANGSNNVKTDDLREDMCYTGEYELGIYLWDFIKIKENIQAYRNDSNNQYYDYYDYFAFRAKTSVVAIFTEKLYSVTSFTYTRKLYDDRLSTENNVHQKDNLYVFNMSLLYELTPSFTLAAGYSYRENTSNEPLEKYSGSVCTVGLYYTF